MSKPLSHADLHGSGLDGVHMTLPSSELIGIVVCLVLSAFFSSSETALTSLGRARIDKLMNESAGNHKALQLWLDKPREILTTILIGNNIVNTLASALATSAASQMLSGVQSSSAWLQPIPVAVGVTTLLLLTFGEISPKVLAGSFREVIALNAMRVLRPLHILLFPAVWVFVRLTDGIIRLVGQDDSNQNHVSDEELEFLVHLGSEEGSISADKIGLLESVFEFTDTTAREIMVPRLDVISASASVDVETLLQTILDGGHSRMPVYDGVMDEIIGIVHVKDVFGALNKPEQRANFNIRKLLREAYFVPETKAILPLMREMQAHRNHMAIVVDEFGGIAGIVTLEDIIEEFFGEIWDEHDRETEAGIRQIGERAYRVDARTSLYDLADVFDIEIPEDGDYDTVGGFIAKETGSVARVGTVVTCWGIRFTVVESDRRRLRRVRAEWVGEGEGSQTLQEEAESASGSN